MNKYVDPKALAADGWYLQRYIYGESTVCVQNMNLLDASTTDVVPVGLLEQVEWERDTALAQLAEIGKSLGEKMDDVRPVVQREAVMQALNKYFSIGDSYTYELIRVKEAFYVGTITLDDFEEWDEDNVSDLCDYLMKEIFGPNCGADMRKNK